jgi:uncharacterized protein (TIGR02145 family)
MKENLKVTRYENGEAIQYVQSESSEPNVWENLSTGAYGYYNDDLSYKETYGNLYNWYTVDDSRGVCPENWHVPSDDEFTVLTYYFGGESVAGGKMKECTEGSCPESEYWNSPNTGATNEIGFTGLPAGSRHSDSAEYFAMGIQGYFWCSSGGGDAWLRWLNYSNSEVVAMHLHPRKNTKSSPEYP